MPTNHVPNMCLCVHIVSFTSVITHSQWSIITKQPPTSHKASHTTYYITEFFSSLTTIQKLLCIELLCQPTHFHQDEWAHFG